MRQPDDEWPVPTVPDGLPALTAGRHRSPVSGSCVMEYVSVLAGERWTDRPRCTDPALAALARRVNDDVRQGSRPALAELAPRLVGTVGPDVATDAVIAAVARVGLQADPEDLILSRIHRRARRRIARDAGHGVRARVLRWGHAVTGAGLGATYLHLGRVISDRPRAERDAVRIRALAVATEDVRRRSALPSPVPIGHLVRELVAT